MGISINWGTQIIYIPKDYLTPLGGDKYELDLNAFRSDLKALEESEEGISFPDTHLHYTTVTLSGITLAHVLVIINGYTVTFENGIYSVNAIGSNSNIADVMNLNYVSLRTFNSAGMVVVSGGAGVSDWTDAEKAQVRDALGINGDKTASSGGQIQGIKAKTDNLPDDPASNTEVDTRLAADSYIPPDNVAIGQIKSKTDQLPSDPASNTQVETRLAATEYTLPDNTGIGQIKSQTDKLSFSGSNIQSRVADKGVLNDVSAGDIDSQLSSVHGDGSWEGGGGGSDPTEVANAVWSHSNATMIETVLNAVATKVEFLRKIETGRWKISGNVLTIYNTNGTTPLIQFNLLDKSGKAISVPSGTPAERSPI